MFYLHDKIRFAQEVREGGLTLHTIDQWGDVDVTSPPDLPESQEEDDFNGIDDEPFPDEEIDRVPPMTPEDWQRLDDYLNPEPLPVIIPRGWDHV